MHYVQPVMEVIRFEKLDIVTQSLIDGGSGSGNGNSETGEGGVTAPEDDWG